MSTHVIHPDFIFALVDSYTTPSLLTVEPKILVAAFSFHYHTLTVVIGLSSLSAPLSNVFQLCKSLCALSVRLLLVTATFLVYRFLSC
jgi:hypothetical protein